MAYANKFLVVMNEVVIRLCFISESCYRLDI